MKAENNGGIPHYGGQIHPPAIQSTGASVSQKISFHNFSDRQFFESRRRLQ